MKRDDYLTFKVVGGPVALHDVADEFSLMKGFLKKPLTAEIAARVCERSGSHLLKMVSARAEGDEACLYFASPEVNHRPKILPSTNAGDILYCKVLFRPLDILGHPTRCVVDDIMNPDDASESILDAFASVFGKDVLDAMREKLLENPKRVTKLAAGEFPIIFVPRPDGKDLQITPVSPASAFTDMRTVINSLYDRRKAEGGKVPRGAFLKQSVSSKPQNISGAIGDPRRRIMAAMPPVLNKFSAELYRFVHGGSFPRWQDPDVANWVLRYADMLDADTRFNDKNTRAALDRTANRLIQDADAFIAETYEEAIRLAIDNELDPATLAAPPPPDRVLILRAWPKDSFDKARQALASLHFVDRMAKKPQPVNATRNETPPR